MTKVGSVFPKHHVRNICHKLGINGVNLTSESQLISTRMATTQNFYFQTHHILSTPRSNIICFFLPASANLEILVLGLNNF